MNRLSHNNNYNNMGLKNQKHLRRSAIAKKQHSNSSGKGHRAIPYFVITDLHNEYNAHCKKNARIRKFN